MNQMPVLRLLLMQVELLYLVEEFVVGFLLAAMLFLFQL
jgi:hypothetical protein